MKYKFPVIKNINDKAVQDALAAGSFILADKGKYKVISYILNTPDTFPEVVDESTAVMREFRGLIFDSATGNLIRRPLHKFFNHGERNETREISFDSSHSILEKLDGSMIAPFMTSDGVLRWGTKMGETDVSKQVEDFLANNQEHVEFARNLLSKGITPIFEWCSRKQRIVLDYKKDDLVLLAARVIETGEYIPYHVLSSIVSASSSVNLVSVLRGGFGRKSKMNDSFLQMIKQQEGVEGVIVRFEDGHMVKIKSDWYCKIHKAKDDISKEHNLVALILEEKIDDLKSVLVKEDVDRIDVFTSQLEYAINLTTRSMLEYIQDLKSRNISKKQFALEYSKDVEKWKHGCIFSHLNSETVTGDTVTYQSVFSYVKDYVLKNCNKAKNYQEMRQNCQFMSNVDSWTEIELES